MLSKDVGADHRRCRLSGAFTFQIWDRSKVQLLRKTGETVSFDAFVTNVFEEHDDRWLIVSHQATPIFRRRNSPLFARGVKVHRSYGHGHMIAVICQQWHMGDDRGATEGGDHESHSSLRVSRGHSRVGGECNGV